jgi:hypothetical protein
MISNHDIENTTSLPQDPCPGEGGYSILRYRSTPRLWARFAPLWVSPTLAAILVFLILCRSPKALYDLKAMQCAEVGSYGALASTSTPFQRERERKGPGLDLALCRRVTGDGQCSTACYVGDWTIGGVRVVHITKRGRRGRTGGVLECDIGEWGASCATYYSQSSNTACDSVNGAVKVSDTLTLVTRRSMVWRSLAAKRGAWVRGTS